MLIMNRIFKYILCAFTALSFAACSGTVDPEQDGGGTGGPASGKEDVPEGVLRIFADKTSITADGNDEVTFTVMFGKKDVSTAKTLQLIRTFEGDDKYMAYGANRFSTVTGGTYKFKAKYYYGGNHVSDNEIEIVAEQFFSGEEKNYKRRFFGALFTSVGCSYCPLSAQGLKELQEKYPGEISAVAFHSDFSGFTDPMTIPETADFNAAFGGFTGLPNFFWNMRKESRLDGSANLSRYEESFGKEKNTYQTYSGVAVNTSFDVNSRKLDIEVGITSNLPAVFRYQVILVEDNIPAVGEYEQQGNADMRGYIHYNAARDVLTGARGDKLNDDSRLTVGVEAKARKSVTLKDGWKPENMRVIVTALTSEDGGYVWTVNNVNECKVGGNAPYLYVE